MKAFEARYWNQHVQRKVCDRLEFGKYVYALQTKEQYVIQQVAKAKHLSPPTYGSRELIHNLAYHFEQNIRVAMTTRGISWLKDLLVLLSQWEDLINKDQSTLLVKHM